MKKTRKAVSVVLALVLLFTLSVPVFAAKAKPRRDYQTYLCLGDSIAAGTSLTRSGEECVFDQTIAQEDVWGANDDDVIFRGFDYEVAPNAYHSLIHQGLVSALGHKVGFIQGARSGLRAVELRYLLDGVYNDYDETHLWGNTFLNVESMLKELSSFIGGSDDGEDEPRVDLFTLKDVDDLNGHLAFGQRGRCTNYLEGFSESDDSRINDPDSGYVAVENYIDAVKKADLISINLGSNDVFSFTLDVVLNEMDKEFSIPGFSEAADLLRETGDLGAAFAKLVDTCETVGMVGTLVTMFLTTLQKSLDQFEVNYKAIVKKIYELNPDVDIVAIGCYNPLTQVRISSGSNFNLDAIAAPFMLRLNEIIESFATGEHADHYLYVDVSNTQTHAMNADDALFKNYFIFKVHPTLAGHRYIADRVLNALGTDPSITAFFAGSVHYLRLFEQLVKNLTGNISALFARLLNSGFVFGPVSFGK